MKHGRHLRNVGRFLPLTIYSNRYWPILPTTLSLQFALLSHSTSVTCVFYRQKFMKSQTNYYLHYCCCTFDLSELTLHNNFSRNRKQNLPGLTCNPRSDIAFLIKINSPIQNLHNLSLVFFVLWCCIQTTYSLTEDVTVHDPTLNVTKCFMDVILCTRWHTQQHSVSFQVILNFDSTSVTVSHLLYSILIIWS
jgi:hypothetical protein